MLREGQSNSPYPSSVRILLVFVAEDQGSVIFHLDFCKMAIGPIFFKEILFFDFLEEST